MILGSGDLIELPVPGSRIVQMPAPAPVMGILTVPGATATALASIVARIEALEARGVVLVRDLNGDPIPDTAVLLTVDTDLDQLDDITIEDA